MDEDISNKTIVVLVVLTVIISVLSTLVVLNEVMNIKSPNSGQTTAVEGGQKTSSGKVTLEIKPDVPKATGQVIMEIK